MGQQSSKNGSNKEDEEGSRVHQLAPPACDQVWQVLPRVQVHPQVAPRRQGCVIPALRLHTCASSNCPETFPAPRPFPLPQRKWVGWSTVGLLWGSLRVCPVCSQARLDLIQLPTSAQVRARVLLHVVQGQRASLHWHQQ